MHLNEYQKRAMSTAVYPRNLGLMYVGLKLAGEAGEFTDKLGKSFRDGSLAFYNDALGVPSHDLREALIGELGDVLWYVAAGCAELHITMDQLAQRNLDKLSSRSMRGVLLGDGDDR